MSMIRILDFPDPLLERVGIPVPVEDITSQSIQTIIDDMVETLYNTRNCAALAATQLDIPNAPAITVIDLSEARNDLHVVINPQILEEKGTVTEKEGCMSVYPSQVVYPVKRAFWVKVSCYTRDGQAKIYEEEGYMARCLQHEIDHLNGKVYLARLSAFKKSRVLKKIEKAIKQNSK